MSEIKPADKSRYHVPVSGHPLLHEELAWYVTDTENVLGVLIRDRVDYDFSWVVLTKQDGMWCAIKCVASRETAAIALQELKREMTTIDAQLSTD
jgi:hypothetical protein